MVREALRSAERRQRQLQTLQELMNTTAKADVLDFLDGLPDDSFAAQVTTPLTTSGSGTVSARPQTPCFTRTTTAG
jgi:hypothetical protein